MYSVAFWIRKKYIAEDDPTRKYFIMGLNAKVFGAFATSLIYWYYYGTGDTIYYFQKIEAVRDLISKDFNTGMKMFVPKYFLDEYLVQINLWRIRYNDLSYKTVVQIGTFFSFFVAKTYIGITLIFSFLSYLGLWLLYRVFYHQFPSYGKPLAYVVLLVPSVVFWGSGLFKDTISIGCTGWLVYNIYRVFINPSRRRMNLILLVVNVYMIAIIKTYIIACLVPMLLAWVVLTFRSNIKSNFIRTSITPFLIVATIVGGAVMTKQISSMSDRFSLDQLEKRATDMVWWHTQVKEIYGEEGGGSSYSLGNPYDFSPTGILKKVPLAINVTYFRPYLWEAKNPVVFISALESLALFLFFGILFINIGPKLISRMFGKPFLIFCFGFSLLFAVGVGITSYNFGALVRYKIPAMPFFVGGLTVLYYDMKERKKSKENQEEIEITEENNLSQSS